MAEQQLIEGVYLNELGITREDWNLARNLIINVEPNMLRTLTLDRVVANSGLRETVMSEIRTANYWYPHGIADCESKGKFELMETLKAEYHRLRTTDPLQNLAPG